MKFVKEVGAQVADSQLCLELGTGLRGERREGQKWTKSEKWFRV